MSEASQDRAVLDPNLQIRLPEFEGPLDLLLYLIQKHELDILNLPMAFVAEEYRKYLDVMHQLDLDVASEYLLMAATLVHIKSKMLLPSVPAEQDDEALLEEELDPRAELVRRLLTYQKYKAAGHALLERDIEGRDSFTRGNAVPEASEPPPLGSASLFSLLDAFQAVLKRKNLDFALEITRERISIQDRMMQITELLTGRPMCLFEELFDDVFTKSDLVITFLAVLEMAKMKLAQVVQVDSSGPIHIRLAVSVAPNNSLDNQVEAQIESQDHPELPSSIDAS